MKITQRKLESVATKINNITGNPVKTHLRESDGAIANIGNYHIVFAGNKAILYQMASLEGAADNVFGTGFLPKKTLLSLMQVFILGLEA